jgi:hypothetical protein
MRSVNQDRPFKSQMAPRDRFVMRGGYAAKFEVLQPSGAAFVSGLAVEQQRPLDQGASASVILGRPSYGSG